MKTKEQSVVTSMDGSDMELFSFLPYIFKDLWEIGADPDAIIKLISKHFENCADLKVLDLGCGKGAVSVKISKKLGSRCYGIDATSEFIEFAQQKANEFKVKHLCRFETGDIREKIKELSDYDIIILGAIGPVFGDYLKTLSTLSKCLNEKGGFIIDDAYIDDTSDYRHSLLFKKSDIMQQIEKAGMKLIENDIMDKKGIKDSDDFIFDKLRKRCFELIEKYPEKQNLFLNYIKEQEIENDVLENKAITTTMVIKKKTDC
jgi:ubiquinone/menaquinone biosynthesis C-methylase UbiE